MKVLQLGKFYPIRGGVEKVMYDLMAGLDERGVACDMLCAATSGRTRTVKVGSKATDARNYSSCDSLLLGSKCGAHTFPYIDVANNNAIVEHEATTSKISEDQLFYCNQRGISTEDAVGLIVGGYAKEVINKLPMEFAVEAQKLLSVSLEGSVG